MNDMNKKVNDKDEQIRKKKANPKTTKAAPAGMATEEEKQTNLVCQRVPWSSEEVV